MLIFLDTEFTDLLNPELLSLGIVTLDGREFYAELDLTTDTGKARIKASSAFVQSGIFDMWGLVPGAAGTELEMGRRTGEWLLALAAETGTRIEIAFDYGMDYKRGIPLAPQESDFGFSPLFHHLFVGDRLCHNSLLKQTIKQ
jgi:hypothetical protein